MTPADASGALDKYWLLTIQGNDADAQKVLDQMKQLGMPLPVGD